MMLNTVNKYGYSAFGLRVNSEIHLPEFEGNNKNYDGGAVDIVIDDLSKLWSEAVVSCDIFVIKESFMMFQVPGVAIYLVKEGNKIIVSPLVGSDEDEIRLYLLGTCMGIILLQRKILPLHGSVIAIDGKAYAFVGDSGAGKSTIATAFLSKGYSLLTDDVIPIQFTKEGTPVVFPSYPHQKLWQESLTQFGMDSSQYRPLVVRETKFAVPVSSQFSRESLPLGGIFELVKTKEEEIEVLPVKGLERFHTLYKHTYRNFLIAPSGLMDWHFKTSARIVNNVDLFQLRRPISRFTAHDLPNIILGNLRVGNIEAK